MAKSNAQRASRRRSETFDDSVVSFQQRGGKKAGKQGRLGRQQEDPRWRHQPLQCKTKNQTNMAQLIDEQTITIATGPAGVGKTHVAAWKACEMLDSGAVKRIVLTRPAVEADEKLGFLPGEADEKVAPYFVPYMEILQRYFGRSHLDNLIRNNTILAQPLAYIRGLTFDHSFIILDEAQNTTVRQMKTLLTRIGRFSKVVLDGDLDQSDLRGRNGLQDAVERFETCPGFGTIRFTNDDIVRSDIVRDILLRY